MCACDLSIIGRVLWLAELLTHDSNIIFFETILFVPLAGLEPATLKLRASRCYHLSYRGAKSIVYNSVFCESGAARTRDLGIKSPLLLPTELRIRKIRCTKYVQLRVSESDRD